MSPPGWSVQDKLLALALEELRKAGVSDFAGDGHPSLSRLRQSLFHLCHSNPPPDHVFSPEELGAWIDWNREQDELTLLEATALITAVYLHQGAPTDSPQATSMTLCPVPAANLREWESAVTAACERWCAARTGSRRWRRPHLAETQNRTHAARAIALSCAAILEGEAHSTWASWLDRVYSPHTGAENANETIGTVLESRKSKGWRPIDPEKLDSALQLLLQSSQHGDDLVYHLTNVQRGYYSGTVQEIMEKLSSEEENVLEWRRHLVQDLVEVARTGEDCRLPQLEGRPPLLSVLLSLAKVLEGDPENAFLQSAMADRLDRIYSATVTHSRALAMANELAFEHRFVGFKWDELRSPHASRALRAVVAQSRGARELARATLREYGERAVSENSGPRIVYPLHLFTLMNSAAAGLSASTQPGEDLLRAQCVCLHALGSTDPELKLEHRLDEAQSLLGDLAAQVRSGNMSGTWAAEILSGAAPLIYWMEEPKKIRFPEQRATHLLYAALMVELHPSYGLGILSRLQSELAPGTESKVLAKVETRVLQGTEPKTLAREIRAFVAQLLQGRDPDQYSSTWYAVWAKERARDSIPAGEAKTMDEKTTDEPHSESGPETETELEEVGRDELASLISLDVALEVFREKGQKISLIELDNLHNTIRREVVAPLPDKIHFISFRRWLREMLGRRVHGDYIQSTIRVLHHNGFLGEKEVARAADIPDLQDTPLAAWLRDIRSLDGSALLLAKKPAQPEDEFPLKKMAEALNRLKFVASPPSGLDARDVQELGREGFRPSESEAKETLSPLPITLVALDTRAPGILYGTAEELHRRHAGNWIEVNPGDLEKMAAALFERDSKELSREVATLIHRSHLLPAQGESLIRHQKDARDRWIRDAERLRALAQSVPTEDVARPSPDRREVFADLEKKLDSESPVRFCREVIRRLDQGDLQVEEAGVFLARSAARDSARRDRLSARISEALAPFTQGPELDGVRQKSRGALGGAPPVSVARPPEDNAVLVGLSTRAYGVYYGTHAELQDRFPGGWVAVDPANLEEMAHALAERVASQLSKEVTVLVHRRLLLPEQGERLMELHAAARQEYQRIATRMDRWAPEEERASSSEEVNVTDRPMPKQGDQMSKTEKVGDLVKSDLREIALRSSVKKGRELLVELITQFAARKSTPRLAGESEEDHLQRLERSREGLAAFLLSDAGMGLLAYGSGFAWAMFEDQITDDTTRKYGGIIAREVRIQGGVEVVDEFTSEVLRPLYTFLRNEAQGLMVAAQHGPTRIHVESTTDDRDEEIARLKAELKSLQGNSPEPFAVSLGNAARTSLDKPAKTP